ncbi:hypothetical protein QTP88_020535 [Uroleucon formosanum]
MDTFEDVGSMYIKYQKKSGRSKNELDFYKSELKDAFAEFDLLRQQYYSLRLDLKVMQNESDHYAEEVVQLETEKKTLTDEVTVLQTKNSIFEEEIAFLKEKLVTTTIQNQSDGLNLTSNIDIPRNDVCQKVKVLKLVDDTEDLISSINTFEVLKDSGCKENTSSGSNSEKCDEWWCPKHSDFTEILQKVMLKNQFLYVVRKAKARFVYWQGETNKNMPRCPMQDYKRGKPNRNQKPSFWPTPFQQVENKLEHIIDEAGTAIKEKLKNVLEKNCGFNDLKKISSILTGEATSMEGLPEDLNGNNLAHFKYAPITSSDVEKSFSRYKNVLTDNRCSFEIENIKKVLVM